MLACMKRPYKDKVSALRALCEASKEPNYGQSRVYQCPYCFSWHFTKLKVWKAKNARKGTKKGFK